MTTLKTTKQTSSKPSNPLEALWQDTLAGRTAFGHTVTEEPDTSDGQEYQVVFPANRGSAPSPSESQSNTSTVLDPINASGTYGSSSEPDAK